MTTSKVRWSELFLFAQAKFLLPLILVCLLISAALGSYVPSMVAAISENYKNDELYFDSMMALLGIFVGVYINRVFYQLAVNKYVKLLIQRVRSFCYERWILKYDVQTSHSSKSEQFPQGEVLARIMSDTEAVRELITSGTFGIFIDLFFVISCLVGFITMNSTSGVIIAVAEFVAAALLIWGSKYMRRIFLSVRRSAAQVSRTMANMVGGLRETYYTRHENYASKKGEVVFEDFLHKQLLSNVWDASYYSLAESLYPLFLLLVVVIFPYSQITEAAVILAIVDLIQRSIRPIKDVASKIANVQRAATGFFRIKEFLAHLSEGQSSVRYQKLRLIEFNRLSVNIEHFSYPTGLNGEAEKQSSFSLDDLQFEARRGELVGIVGLSGCGKSTVLNIIAANIIPTQASICLEHGDETLEFPGRSGEDIIRYREQVGIVSQDSHIFSESLAFNICLCPETPDDFSEFWSWLCEQIPYLKVWGHGPESKLDQNDLSVGQKQLLAAVRSCYLKKTIVLFDEIASGLDSELELALRKVILLVQRHSLTFIVAHRLETIVQADKIIVLDQGRLVAQGTHSQLIDESLSYREFISEVDSTILKSSRFQAPQVDDKH